MNHKVLLADDSLTIQKVIKITLANQPYDIIDASSEEDLFKQLPIIRPKLVLLDFNLSEKYSGYELTSKIKEILPTAQVLLLLGTFDTIDEAVMEKCGAADKIVKPFDSNKFIAICRQLIDTFGQDEIPYPKPKLQLPPVIQEDLDDQWKVSHSSEHKAPILEQPKVIPQSKQNPLLKEVSDWGMSVPGVIDQNSTDTLINLPPVINDGKSAFKTTREDQKFPDTGDLDYPTIEETFSKENEGSASAAGTTSKLISIESFNEKPLEFEIQGNNVSQFEDTNIQSLEAQIRDEIEEDLWKIDEFEDLKNDINAKIEEAKNNFKPSLNDFDESLFKPIDDPTSIEWTENESLVKSEFSGPLVIEPSGNYSSHQSYASSDMSFIRSEMEEMVKRYVKQYMDELFQKSSEKVAWEVIPDLAENLIRQELSKISNKILNE